MTARNALSVVITLHSTVDGRSSTIRERGLVTAAPHVTLEGKEGDGRTYIIEIFTWRDASNPDNASEAVKKWLKRM
jgi:hypothetical protein